nr:protein ptst, chloroplastic [Ipomoea batatas]
MVSLIRTPTHFCVPPQLKSSFRRSSVLALSRGLELRCPVFSFVATKKQEGVFGFLQLRRSGRGIDSCCWCGEGGGSASSEGDAELEARILEFMRDSEKPGAFPSRKELEEAGRFDLVEAIRRKGGWFLLGWDSEDDENEVQEAEAVDIDFDMEEFRRRVKSCQDSGAFDNNEEDSLCVNGSSESVSSSGRSLENGAEEDSGVEGILSRLEKHRKSSFDMNSDKSSNGKWALNRDDRNDQNVMTTAVGRSNLGQTITDASDSWRTWSIQRAGFQDAEFEPAEITFGRNQEGKRTSIDHSVVVTENGTGDLHRQSGANHKDIRARIQHLEVELNSALQLIRFKSEENSSKEVIGSSPTDLQKLSDALEFQENQLMHAQMRLRSIRAKLTVLEGKMALATTDAQKTMEKKQNKINGAYLATQLLRTTHIVWPNSVSEVLLAGSFDGWTSQLKWLQRKMEKSSAGIFSVTMLLYPGRYEFKFIVDGKWRVDPLRPIIVNHGHENNLLIIT